MQPKRADAVTWLHTSNRARAARAPSAPVEVHAASAPAKRCIPWALPHRCRQWSPGPTGGCVSAQMKQNHKHTGNQLCQVRRHKLRQAAAAHGLGSAAGRAHLQPREAAISQLCGTRRGQQAVAGLDVLGSSGRRRAATRDHAAQSCGAAERLLACRQLGALKLPVSGAPCSQPARPAHGCTAASPQAIKHQKTDQAHHVHDALPWMPEKMQVQVCKRPALKPHHVHHALAVDVVDGPRQVKCDAPAQARPPKHALPAARCRPPPAGAGRCAVGAMAAEGRGW